MLVPLAIAVQFLTIMPTIVNRVFTPREMARSVGFFPLVGLGLGALLAGTNVLLGRVFPDTVSSAIVLSLWVILTGALHLDGFLDSCDGIFGGNTPEKRLEIMRDERVGAFALAGGLLLMLVKFTSILALAGQGRSLILAPMLGRWGITLAIFSFPYAREQGLGRQMKDHISWMQVLLGSIVTIPVSWILGGWDGLIAVGIVGVIVWGGSSFVLTRIPGLTGDIYGALCEVGEVGVLLTFTSLNWVTS